MLFITLCKWRKKPTKEMVAESTKLFERLVKEGGKIHGIYWTLGRYDSVVITEGKDEKEAIKNLLRWSDMLSTETLIAVTREEVLKLMEQ
ncbi:MAG: GYD domain-containing protein [Nitrososphaeria archaeon]